MEKNCEVCLGELFSAQKRKLEEKEDLMNEIGIRHDKVALFLIYLRDDLPFWSGTYRKKISKFCEDMGF